MKLHSPIPHKKTRLEIIPLIDVMFFLLASFMSLYETINSREHTFFDAAVTLLFFLLVGRYCDAFQKRGGEWRVAQRTVVYDWVEEQTPPEGSEAERFGLRQPVGAAVRRAPIDADDSHQRIASTSCAYGSGATAPNPCTASEAAALA